MKNRLYRLKRVFQEIKYLRSHFSNWDTIIKRAISGKHCSILYLKNGLKIHNKHNNTLSIFREIFENKVYTNAIVEIEQGDIVFDVGANIGVFSLFASMVKDVKIYGFEPHPDNFKLYTKNIEVNNKSNITGLNCALGNEDSSRYLVNGVIPGGHKITNHKNNERNESALKVETFSLASIMKKHQINQIDFMKLDCEGAEGEIISSMRTEDLQNVRKIAIEFHDNHSLLNHNQILERLQKADFETQIKWDGNSNYGYIYAKYKQSN